MAEWKRVKLGEVADLVPGFAFKSKAFGDQYSDKVIKITNISENGISDSELPGVDLSDLDKSRLAKFKVTEGDYVLAMTGSIGKIGKVVKGEAYINQRVLTIRPHSDVDKTFLFCAVRTKQFYQYMITHIDSHSVQANISAGSIGEYEFSLPTLSAQRKIAAVLGVLDDKIENNRKICANLEAQAQALFRNSDRGPEIEFTSEINVLGGGTPKTSEPKYWGGDIPFFSPKDVGSPYVTSTERTITSEGLNNCNSELYPAETTFVTARGTVGKVCLTGLPMAMNQSCFALRSQSIDPLLVYFYTKASISSLKNKANGSVFDAITVAEFETEKLCRLTRPSESRFLSVARPMFDEILRRTRESTNLASLRDALLPKLMSGEIDVEKVEV